MLAVDVQLHEVRFVDTLKAIKTAIVEKMKVLLEVLRVDIPGLQWLPESVEGCRIHHCRQRSDVSCGYFVAWFAEEELRQKYGESPMHRGCPDAGAVVKRMLQVTHNLLPAERKLQANLKAGTSSKSGAAASSGATDAATAARAQAEVELQDTLDRTACPDTAVRAEFSLEEFGGDIEHWATNVMQLLSAAHQVDVSTVKHKHPVTGCSKCHDPEATGMKRCWRCYWPHTVRYWRNLETQGRLGEGYAAAHVKGAMKRGTSGVLETGALEIVEPDA